MKYITREKYMNRLIDLKGTPDIKIITGIRRSGKSELMRSYIEHIKKEDANANIIYIDYTDLAFDDVKEYHKLHEFVENHYCEAKVNYLFVDEVQLCPQFELAINSLYSKRKYDIYITGSNAFLLSNDLSTLFTGRYIELHVFLLVLRNIVSIMMTIMNMIDCLIITPFMEDGLVFMYTKVIKIKKHISGEFLKP